MKKVIKRFIQVLLQVVLFAILIFVSSGQLVWHWAWIYVRLQYDRSHQVATSGPYKYVRHPGYIGFIVFNLATPLMLGSLWALIPGVIMTILFIIRTALEDSTLRNELEGYKEYALKVSYRLIPGVW